jgi:hypothetical protein
LTCGCTTCALMQRAAQGLRQGGQWSSTDLLIFSLACCQLVGPWAAGIHRRQPALLGPNPLNPF